MGDARIDAACEAIYADFNGYWPSESERRRIESALKPLASECEKLKAALAALVAVAESPQSHPGMYGDCVMCQAVTAARALVGSAPQTESTKEI